MLRKWLLATIYYRLFFLDHYLKKNHKFIKYCAQKKHREIISVVLNNAEQQLTWFLLTRIESIRVNFHLALISCNKVIPLGGKSHAGYMVTPLTTIPEK